MNESALKAPLLVAIGALLGFASCWFYRDKTDAEQIAISATQNLSAIESAAPATALQVESLSRTANKRREIENEYQEIAPAILPLSDCPAPAELASLLANQDIAAREAASGASIKTDVPEDK